ncbi:MAG: hypothetical protein M0D55_14350 [Elusimicrobiota bacterium]|nr:MAG: hypothetical protein M0D55_14350 [Elusimicrobiota bacterium]
MGNLPPEDLNREIERLWARLGGVAADAAPPSSPPSASAGAELAWETASMLKVQQRRREAAMAEALEAKEQSLAHWRRRAEALQAEVEDLRSRVTGGDELVLARLLDAQGKLEAAAAALDAERATHAEERRFLQAALDEARSRVAAEAARARDAEARWTKRETQHLIDLKDVQTSAERRQREAAEADASVAALKGSLAEAKNALEKTLAELLLERRERSRVEEERARALKKTDEVQAHFDELQKLWEEERAQWRELWDRERSTWEAQRQELAHWEESLRREREAWHAELQEKEKTHLSFTDSLTGKLRETTAAAADVAERMRLIESREERERGAQAKAAVEAGATASKRSRRARTAGLVLAAAAAVAAAFPAGRWAMEWRWEPEATAPAPGLNPTALAYDGRLLWVADWGAPERRRPVRPAPRRARGRGARGRSVPPDGAGLRRRPRVDARRRARPPHPRRRDGSFRPARLDSVARPRADGARLRRDLAVVVRRRQPRAVPPRGRRGDEQVLPRRRGRRSERARLDRRPAVAARHEVAPRDALRARGRPARAQGVASVAGSRDDRLRRRRGRGGPPRVGARRPFGGALASGAAEAPPQAANSLCRFLTFL